MHFAGSHTFTFFAETTERVFYVAAFCTALELIFPASRYSLKSRLRGALYWLAYAAAATLIWRVSTLVFRWIGIHPLLTIDIGTWFHTKNRAVTVIGEVAAGVIVAMIADFFYYWFHRLQHAVPVLWRFHAVHHSVREMGAFNCNHHITEDAFRLPFVTLPLSLIQFDSGFVPAIAVLLIGAQPIFEHACTRLHLGPLRYLIGDPRFHRIHHSLERKHWHVNFGSFTTVWDTLFRTAMFPQRGEWPEVGLPDEMEPLTMRDFVLQPFRAKEKNQKTADIAVSH
jgi:sterol desaturase/sphingolipid hydroxylase (fatty acid hydroxylase superfamily)